MIALFNIGGTYYAIEALVPYVKAQGEPGSSGVRGEKSGGGNDETNPKT